MATKSSIDRAMHLRELIQTGRARELRQGAGLTLANVATDCQVNPSAVHHWETGHRAPRGRNVSAYYRVLTRLAELVPTTEPSA